MGKHFYYSYNLYGAPTLSGTTTNGEQFGFVEATSPLAWSSRHALEFNYVLFRHLDVGVNVNLFKTGLINQTSDRDGQTYEEVGQLNGQSYGIHAHQYRRNIGALAPLGQYFRYELQFLNARYNSPNGTIHDGYTVKLGYIGIGIGRRYIFSDRIVFNFALQAGGVFSLWNNPQEDSATTELEHHEFIRSVRNRLQKHYFLQGNLGIGILLF